MRLAELNKLAEDPGLWNDQQRAQRLMQERTALDYRIKPLEHQDREAVSSEAVSMPERKRQAV